VQRQEQRSEPDRTNVVAVAASHLGRRMARPWISRWNDENRTWSAFRSHRLHAVRPDAKHYTEKARRDSSEVCYWCEAPNLPD
jgi:hypothetical protein